MRHQNHSEISNANPEPEGTPIIKPETAGLLLQAAEHQGRFPPKRYGCLGQQGSCPEHRRRAWRSLVTFFEHLQDNHLGEFETPDGLMCPECAKRDDSTSPIAYPSDGRELAKHIWTDHMTSMPGRSSSGSSQ